MCSSSQQQAEKCHTVCSSSSRVSHCVRQCQPVAECHPCVSASECHTVCSSSQQQQCAHWVQAVIQSARARDRRRFLPQVQFSMSLHCARESRRPGTLRGEGCPQWRVGGYGPQWRVSVDLVGQAMVGGAAGFAEGRRMRDLICDPAFEAAGGLVRLAAACPAAAQLDNDGVAIFWKSSKFVAHSIELHPTSTAVKVHASILGDCCVRLIDLVLFRCCCNRFDKTCRCSRVAGSIGEQQVPHPTVSATVSCAHCQGAKAFCQCRPLTYHQGHHRRTRMRGWQWWVITSAFVSVLSASSSCLSAALCCL